MKRVKASPLGGSCRPQATDEGMLEPMNALDRLSGATATSSGGRCRHLPLQGKAISTLHSPLFTLHSPLSTLNSAAKPRKDVFL
ncbi:MAG: hypothetical protein ACI4RP_00020 [Acutalibacteraceae bacterium]